MHRVCIACYNLVLCYLLLGAIFTSVLRLKPLYSSLPPLPPLPLYDNNLLRRPPLPARPPILLLLLCKQNSTHVLRFGRVVIFFVLGFGYQLVDPFKRTGRWDGVCIVEIDIQVVEVAHQVVYPVEGVAGMGLGDGGLGTGWSGVGDGVQVFGGFCWFAVGAGGFVFVVVYGVIVAVAVFVVVFVVEVISFFIAILVFILIFVSLIFIVILDLIPIRIDIPRIVCSLHTISLASQTQSIKLTCEK